MNETISNRPISTRKYGRLNENFDKSILEYFLECAQNFNNDLSMFSQNNEKSSENGENDQNTRKTKLAASVKQIKLSENSQNSRSIGKIKMTVIDKRA